MTSAESPWAPSRPAPSVDGGGGPVTLVEGQTFCLSARSAEISASQPQGLFVLDTRVLSRWQFLVNGQPLEALAVAITEPFTATFVGRSGARAGAADADLVVICHRHVGRGMRERIIVTNYGIEPATLDLELACDVDFADLFEVKEGRARRRGDYSHRSRGGNLVFSHSDERGEKQVTVSIKESGTRAGEGESLHSDKGAWGDSALLSPGSIIWQPTLARGQTWEACLEISVRIAEQEIEPRFRCGVPDETTVPSQRLASWRARLPTVETDRPEFAAALSRAGEDLGALRIFDPDYPDRPVLAAGAPWFMTVFGRDSLLTAWMTLPADASLAHSVLTTLARFQGREVDEVTEEQPGKILHEMRFGAARGMSLGGGDRYYGSIDATPLFVMVLGELRRWESGEELVHSLLPAADRAMNWIEEFGDRDGDGYVEYERSSPRGLANQGWKDSWDAVRFADGRLARTPIALCEVQGYVYAAYVARSHFAREAGDRAEWERWQAKAVDLRERFNQDFWLEDKQCFAIGLDAEKRPIDAVASNMGHCLWTGIVDPERAATVADRLLSPEMFSGWGVRTLATDMAAYNPVSYHNGSVWPHDNALCAAGLARYGFLEHAHRIINAQLDVAATSVRLPELFAGFDRSEVPVPAAYPASCSPQAWASAAPLSWLRTILRLDPWAPQDRVYMAPSLPPGMERLKVDDIHIGGYRLGVEVNHESVEVSFDGPMHISQGPRPPISSSTWLEPNATG